MPSAISWPLAEAFAKSLKIMDFPFGTVRASQPFEPTRQAFGYLAEMLTAGFPGRGTAQTLTIGKPWRTHFS
jgi:hypothetical protein